MDLRGNMETDAFQWEDHHGTARLIHWHPAGNGLLCEDRTWRLQNSSTGVQQKLLHQMDIRVDAGFHHRNPNVYIPLSCIDNPGNKFEPQYIPLTIFNLSKVDYLYIGRDTVVAFADKPAVNVYYVEIASDEKIKEHLAKPRNWVPQHHKTLPEIPSNTAFICSTADVPGHRKVHLQDKEISADVCQRFLKSCVKSMVKHSPNTMRTLTSL